ncbi:hypothetical protein NQD34_005941 [Periophthalmus magnuspinnatus]|nr:hypothetical protein NQD34_005941 [Periophthalmus magnuspinnatus]
MAKPGPNQYQTRTKPGLDQVFPCTSEIRSTIRAYCVISTSMSYLFKIKCQMSGGHFESHLAAFGLSLFQNVRSSESVLLLKSRSVNPSPPLTTKSWVRFPL